MQLARKKLITLVPVLALALALPACASAPPTATSGVGNDPAGTSPAVMAAEIQGMRDRVLAMGDNPSPEDVQQMMGDMTGMLDRMQTTMGGAAGSPMGGADMTQMQDMMGMMQSMGGQMQVMVGTMTPAMADMMARMSEMHSTLDQQVTPGDPHHPTP